MLLAMLPPTPTVDIATKHVAAPAPSYLYVILAGVEYDARLGELMKMLHDAYEVKHVSKDGETHEKFEGLDTRKNKGEVTVGEASVQKWKVAEGKTGQTAEGDMGQRWRRYH
ncbi:hypothetical protein B0H10DRAFT_1959013 [Mycena sp. CBHHK59/15]|nr:hypothetical protein B0H10DRAFT_1959013 [Mycena sp. CBHHK59/15]